MPVNSLVWQQQKPLYDRYDVAPEQARITDVAWVQSDDLSDPFHTTVWLNEELKKPADVGLHRAVGGLHDQPNPGDYLAAALAACFESTLRMIANRFGIKIEQSKIKATAHADVKGTLMIDQKTPVGFTQMDLSVQLVANQADRLILRKLVQGAEHCCVVYQTLKNALPIRTTYELLAD